MPGKDQSCEREPQRKILMVCPYVPCRGVHGGGNMMFNLIRALSARHQITVLSFYEDEGERRHAEALAPYCRELELVSRTQTFHARDPFAIDPPEITYEFYNERMRTLVERHLHSIRFDIMQCEFLQTAHFAAVDHTIPVVLTNHEVLSLAHEKSFRSAPLSSARKFRSLIHWMRMLNYEEKMLRRISAVVVLTAAEQMYLSSLLPGLAVYRHAMGVDCDYFIPSDQRGETRAVVFVGNFRHAPNTSGVAWFLNHVWPKILSRTGDAKFYVVGGDPPAWVQARNGTRNVTVTGFVDDVRPYLARASVFVAPLFDGAGVRTKVLEAWAMAKPVVGTSLAFDGIDEHPELCITAQDETTFADRVSQLLENPILAAQQGAKAREVVVRAFSWQSFVSFYEQVYTQLLGAQGSQLREAPCPRVQREVDLKI